MKNVERKSFDLIHYGTDSLDPGKIKAIRNRSWTKPHGGLWSSPVDSEYGWKEWCAENDFGNLSKHSLFKFEGVTLTIDCAEDLDSFSWNKINGMDSVLAIDFENLVLCGIDAIHLTVRGERMTRWSGTKNLYGWDCETVLVMHPDRITITPPKPVPYIQPKRRRVSDQSIMFPRFNPESPFS